MHVLFKGLYKFLACTFCAQVSFNRASLQRSTPSVKECSVWSWSCQVVSQRLDIIPVSCLHVYITSLSFVSMLKRTINEFKYCHIYHTISSIVSSISKKMLVKCSQIHCQKFLFWPIFVKSEIFRNLFATLLGLFLAVFPLLFRLILLKFI